MHDLLILYITFLKIGAVNFGGGYSMLPLLERELVTEKKWVTTEDLLDYFAIGQCTPGVIAVNTATFIGSKLRGVIGGIAATLGVVFPSLVIISVIAAFISNFADLAVVKDAFAGIRVCVFVLILNAVVKLGKASVKDALTLCICLAVLAASVLLDLSPIVFVLCAGIAGIVAKVLLAKEGKK